MAEEEEQINIIFPQPPPFYKHFTTHNLERLKVFKEAKEQGKDGEASESATASGAGILELPPELRYLVPPEPPEDGRLRVFGTHLDVHHSLQSLQEDGIEQLYPSPPTPPAGQDSGLESAWTIDRAQYLQRIVRSILLNFLELLGIMSMNPAEYEPKMAHLRTLFANAHQLINEYRPHQARETLILMMEEQLERKKAEIEGVRQMKERIEQALAELGKNALEQAKSTKISDEAAQSDHVKRRENQRQTWAALNEI